MRLRYDSDLHQASELLSFKNRYGLNTSYFGDESTPFIKVFTKSFMRWIKQTNNQINYGQRSCISRYINDVANEDFIILCDSMQIQSGNGYEMLLKTYKSKFQ